ncbi:hypothetical protein BC835DRAFT_1307531 [Cytidiella melzeri]|nr:hypothetical protein BC835DRAFT_1307531 [Cytidiella melzeri]
MDMPRAGKHKKRSPKAVLTFNARLAQNIMALYSTFAAALLWCQSRLQSSNDKANERTTAAASVIISSLPTIHMEAVEPAQSTSAQQANCLEMLNISEDKVPTYQYGTSIPLNAGIKQEPESLSDVQLRDELWDFCTYGHLNLQSFAFVNNVEDLENMCTINEDTNFRILLQKWQQRSHSYDDTVKALTNMIPISGFYNTESESGNDCAESLNHHAAADDCDDSEWALYETKTMFMVAFLDSLPLCLSNNHLKTILWVMQQCGTPNVPSFSALRAVQARLKSTVGPTSTQHVSTLGNEFHMNSAPKLFSLDFANTLVWPHICPYIEISPLLSQFYQAEHLQNENVNLLQLMWADFNRSPHWHFYIKELAQTDNGTFVIPMRWTCKAVIRVNDTLTCLKASRLKSTYLDLSLEFNLHLHHTFVEDAPECATSPHASALELADGLSQDIEAGQWHEGYNCALQEEILFCIINQIEPADNPQQSELCLHIRMQGSCFCRCCKVGGPLEDVTSKEGYRKLFWPTIPCTVPETVAEITAQLVAASHGVAKTVETMQTKSEYSCEIRPQGTSIMLSEKQSQIRASDHFNILLTLDGLNVHQDTLIEILHTWGLGQGKYAWHKSTTMWNNQQLTCLAIWLQSSSVDGLSTSMFSIRGPYFVKYWNALVGKHFKAIQQVMVFHLYTELRNLLLLALWRATGEVGALLHYSRIDNLESYLADLEILIDNVLDIWAELDPLRIIEKGPVVIYLTEIFECWNTIFWTCSILSNHQSPSHNIAESFGKLECFKHLISGGWWRTNAGKYVQAGEGVQNMFLTYPDIQQCLVWVDQQVLIPVLNNFKRVSKAEELQETYEHTLVFNSSSQAPEDRRIRCVLISKSSTTLTFILINQFNIREQLDERTCMPVLVPCQIHIQCPTQLPSCGVQHQDSGFVQQEHQDTTLSCKVVMHEARDCYLLNLHRLHNTSLIRQALPQHLTKPVPYFQDRANKHCKFAAAARQLLMTKRSDAAAKAKATCAQNLKAAPNKLQPQAAGVLDTTSPLDNP